MAKIRPLRNYVLIRPDDEKNVSDGGIFLPGKAAEKPNTGMVIAVGPGEYDDKGEHIEVGVEEGNRVMFYEEDGQEITEDGVTYRIIPSIQLIGVFFD